MQVRKAAEGDIPVLAQIWHQGWLQSHAEIVAPDLVALRSKSEFTDRTEAHLSQTHVGLIEGQIAGFFMLKGAELYQFYVDSAYQGRGVATDLMRQAEAALRGQKAHLACSVGNDRAAAFYRKTGWVHVRTGPYEVETSDGPRIVQEWRFEKDL